MTACRETILAAALAKLSAIAGIAGLTVEAERPADAPLAETDLPRLVLYEGPETPREILTGQRDWTLTVSVEGYVKASTALAARQAGAALRAKAQTALLADVTLATQASDVRPGAEPEPARLVLDCADPTYAFALSFDIDYATAEADLETFA